MYSATLLALLAAGAPPAFASQLREPAPDARPDVVLAANAPLLRSATDAADIEDGVAADAGAPDAAQDLRGATDAAAVGDGLLRVQDDLGVGVEESRPSECPEHQHGWTWFSADRCRRNTDTLTVHNGFNTDNKGFDTDLVPGQGLTEIEGTSSAGTWVDNGKHIWYCWKDDDERRRGAASASKAVRRGRAWHSVPTPKGKRLAADYLSSDGRICWYYAERISFTSIVHVKNLYDNGWGPTYLDTCGGNSQVLNVETNLQVQRSPPHLTGHWQIECTTSSDECTAGTDELRRLSLSTSWPFLLKNLYDNTSGYYYLNRDSSGKAVASKKPAGAFPASFQWSLEHAGEGTDGNIVIDGNSWYIKNEAGGYLITSGHATCNGKFEVALVDKVAQPNKCEPGCKKCGYNWYGRHCKPGQETQWCNPDPNCGCCGGTAAQQNICKDVCVAPGGSQAHPDVAQWKFTLS